MAGTQFFLELHRFFQEQKDTNMFFVVKQMKEGARDHPANYNFNLNYKFDVSSHVFVSVYDFHTVLLNKSFYFRVLSFFFSFKLSADLS